MAQSDNAFRTGAKVWILSVQGGVERAGVRGLSKGGRRITKYIPFKRLENYRAKWIPEGLRDEVMNYFVTDDRAKAEADADELNERWHGIRFYSRTGELMRDGKPSRDAWSR